MTDERAFGHVAGRVRHLKNRGETTFAAGGMEKTGDHSGFADHLRKFYWTPYFWHRAYYVGSIGNASLETVKRYVAAQGTQEKPRKAAKRPPPA